MQFFENYDPVQTKNVQSKKKNPPYKELGHVKMLGVATLCFKAFQPLLWQENWEKTCSKWIRMKMDGWMGHLPKPVSLGLIDKVPVSVSPVFLSSTRWTNICTPISFYFSFYSSSRFNNSVQFNRFGNQQQHVSLSLQSYLWNEKVTRRQFSARLLHLAVTLGL